MDQEKKVLVAGWFSFELGHATAGDIMASNLTGEWLNQAGYHVDVAFDPPFEGGVNWRIADPADYSHVVFVCGPFQQGEYEADFLNRFSNCRLIGLNLSMLVALSVWQPFDFLLERNSSVAVRPDIVFLAREPHVPVVGICRVESYPGALDGLANEAIDRLIHSRQMAVISIDTRLDSNDTNLRTAAEIESLIAKVDVLITTRLHGTVLALKNKVPVLAIDPEAGGDKIRRQAEKIGWPIIFTADALEEEALRKGFDYCLTQDARDKAYECYNQSVDMVNDIRAEFISEMINPVQLEANFKARLANSAANNLILRVASPHQNRPVSLWPKMIKKAGGKIIKSIAYWTLPAPVYNFFLAKKGGTVNY